MCVIAISLSSSMPIWGSMTLSLPSIRHSSSCTGGISIT